MLDPDRNQTIASGIQAGNLNDESSALTLADILAAFRRQRLILCLFAVLGLGAGGVFLFFVKPNFQATATILIDTRKYPDSPQAEVVARTTYDSSAAIDTQVEILKSQTLARAVVDKLSLWDEPEFTASGGGLRAILANYLGSSKGASALSLEERRGRAMGYFFKHLSVKRVSDTFTIDITFESKYADHAATVANATAQAFIDWQRGLHHAAISSAGEWLEERIKDLKEKSSAGQRAVAEYQERNKIFDAGGMPSDERRLTELSIELEAARAQATDAQVKFQQLSQVNANAEKDASDLEVFSAIANVSNDPSIATLRAHYLEITSRYADLSKKLPYNHEALVELRNQIQNAHTTLLGELARVRMMLKNNGDLAQEKAKNLQSEISTAVGESHAAAVAQVSLKQLELGAQTYQNLYDSFLRRYAEALEAERSPAAEASIISTAEAPSLRNYKKTLMMFAIFPALGLLGGGCVAFFRERVNRPFWTSREVESQLRLPCAAIIPFVPQSILSRLRTGDLPTHASRKTVLRDGSPIGWYAVKSPMTRFAEGIRSIRFALRMNGLESSRRAIGITSALPNEGKSSIALAMAVVAASGGAKVILVDCDLRNPALTDALAQDLNKVGLIDVLTGDANIEDIIYVDEETNLHFAPASGSKVHEAVADLAGSDRLAAAINDLKNTYDLVIVDLPPMSPIFDVAMTPEFIDGYFLVVEWGQTKVETVNFALSKMPRVHESIISVVLNKVDVKRIQKYGFYIRDYYSNKYVGRYLES